MSMVSASRNSQLMIEHISAITFAVRDMRASVSFYQKLGFSVTYGSADAEFTTLRCGNAFINLTATPQYERIWWGRVILRVESADRQYERLVAAGLRPDEPKDADWGERYFHISDPDGHELSFAELLPGRL
jgi:catechol 2,3-dioxygenase-like lactoylglutathione lyase family enzyme